MRKGEDWDRINGFLVRGRPALPSDPQDVAFPDNQFNNVFFCQFNGDKKDILTLDELHVTP